MLSNKLINDITLLLRKALPREQKAKAIAEAIRVAGAYRWTGLYDVDSERGLVSDIAWSGSGAPEYPVFPITKGLTSRAITTKRTVNVGDVANDSDYLPRCQRPDQRLSFRPWMRLGKRCWAQLMSKASTLTHLTRSPKAGLKNAQKP